MESEIKVFDGSPIVGERVAKIEKRFGVKIVYSCDYLHISNRINLSGESIISANIYLGIEGKINNLLRLTAYITGQNSLLQRQEKVKLE
jgi:hypothetical protein